MGWKNWPYWLRGGLIGIIVGIILLSIGERTSLPIEGNIFSSASYADGPFLYIVIFALIIFFIIGAIIGLIVGKIKSKRLKTQKPNNIK